MRGSIIVVGMILLFIILLAAIVVVLLATKGYVNVGDVIDIGRSSFLGSWFFLKT